MEIAARRPDVGVTEKLLRENDVVRDAVDRVRGGVAQVVQAPLRREAGAFEAALEPVMHRRSVRSASDTVQAH